MVADFFGRDRFVSFGRAEHGSDVGFGFVREDVSAHERRVLHAGGQPERFRDALRHGRQSRELLVRDHVHAQFELEDRQERRQVGDAVARAVAVDAALNVGRTRVQRRQRVGQRQPKIVVQVNADGAPFRNLEHARNTVGDSFRQ